MAIYPDLNEELDLAIQLMQQDAGWLEDSPYSTGTRGVLASLIETPEEETEGGDKWERLEREARKLYRELNESKEKLGDVDHSERMSYFRTATSLLDKLVGLQERAVGLKQISVFQQTVLDILEDVMTADQRTEVMNRLERSLGSN